MICMDHAARSLGASWVSGHKTLCLLQMPGNSTNAKWTPKPAVLVAAEEGKGRPLAQGMIIHRVTKACHRRLWHRCRSGGIGGGGSRHVPGAVSSQEGKQVFLELHSARGQAVVAESVVTEVIYQSVYTLGERGQVLKGRAELKPGSSRSTRLLTTHPPNLAAPTPVLLVLCKHLIRFQVPGKVYDWVGETCKNSSSGLHSNAGLYHSLQCRS